MDFHASTNGSVGNTLRERGGGGEGGGEHVRIEGRFVSRHAELSDDAPEDVLPAGAYDPHVQDPGGFAARGRAIGAICVFQCHGGADVRKERGERGSETNRCISSYRYF